MWSTVPVLLSKTAPELGLGIVSFLFIAYSIGLFISSFLSGKAYDSYGWIPLVVANAVIMNICYLLLSIATYMDLVWIFFVVSFGLGAVESISTNLVQFLILTHFSENTVPAFSLFRFFFAAGSTLVYAMMLFVNEWFIGLAISINFVAAIICLSFNFWYLAPPPQQEPIPLRDISTSDDL